MPTNDTTIDSLQLAEFMSLFSGNTQNYGIHKYKFSTAGKEQGSNQTVNQLLTETQYKKHLEGKQGLGVVPINEKNECRFGVIDIDAYQEMPDYASAIDRNNMPLVPFRSKSGGMHIYLFTKSEIAANVMISILMDFTILLGIDIFLKQKLNKQVELFPKQTKLAEQASGNWINLPYYNANGTKQYAVTNGKPLSLPDALHHIQGKRQDLSDIRTFLRDMPFSDGPPCLRTINVLGGPSDNRNTYLFSVGTYYKKKTENFWEQKVFEANDSMSAPLDRDEVENTVISSQRKKDYSYKCFESPCVDFCRRPLCKKTKFGVGKEDGYFSEIEFGKMSQIQLDPPYYEWEVKKQGAEKFTMLRFRTEDEIIHQDTFQRLCLRYLHTLPFKMKQSEWAKIVNQAFSEVDIKKIDTQDDTSYMMIFRTLLIDFLVNRAPARTKDQIPHKRVYYDVRKKEYYFRIQDLTTFIFITKNFRYIGPTELHGILRDLGSKPDRIRTESDKQLRVYSMGKDQLDKLGYMPEPQFVAEFEKQEEKEF